MIARIPPLLAGALAAALATGAPAAHACGPAKGGAGVPVRVPLGAADLGTLPEACEATEVSLEGRGALLIAREDFYGSLQAGVGLRGRAVVARRTWVSFWAPALEHRFVANATVEASRTSLGGAAFGGHHRIPIGARASIAPFGRMLFPTETAYEIGSRWGVDHGVVGVVRLRSDLEVVSGFSFTLLSTAIGGRIRSSLAEAIGGDVVFRPWRAFGIAGGMGLRFALADRRPFESFDPRLGLRFYSAGGWFFSLSGVLPLGGRDRTNAGASLSLGFRG